MGDLVRVWATADHFEGELLRGRLEADDIPVLLKGDGEGPYRAGPVYLFVRSEDEVRAHALLDAIASGAFATSDEDVDVPAEDGGVDVPVEPETSS